MVNENELNKNGKEPESKAGEAEQVEAQKEQAQQVQAQEETMSEATGPGPDRDLESAEGEKSPEAENSAAPDDPKSESTEEEETEDFGALFEKSLQGRDFDEGEIIHGVVVSVHKEHVMVDIGRKSEGLVQIYEFKDESGEIKVEAGQEIDVLVDHRDEDDGVLHLSKEKAEKRLVWDKLDEAYENKRPIKGKITEKVKGGLMVDIGVMVFLPSSQADLRPTRNLDKFLNIEDDFMIIKFNRKRGNVVVSRRLVLEQDRNEKRSNTLSLLEKDQIVKGVIKNLTEYGAFIDLGGIDGLLHITDMSYGRIVHPSEIMRVGDEITVKVLRFNRESEKVSLGLKQILPDPWDNVEKKYPVGTIVSGVVVSVTDYGSFVELEKGVEGLVHVSEMSWSKKRIHPSKIVHSEQELEAKVLDIDVLNRRISLSIKQAQPNPWDVLEHKYPEGSTIKGSIRNITNFGVFVGVEEGIDGLVHISDISWTKRVKHPSELLKKGDEVDCIVLKIDKENERFSLGIKQIQPDPWESVPHKYRPGMDVKGKVVNITDFGVFVELEEGIEGLIHISELSHAKVKDPSELVQPGQEVTAEILNVDISERKIRLSIKALEQTSEEAAIKEFKKQEGDGTSKLGELIQDKLSKIKMGEIPGLLADGVTNPDQGPSPGETATEEAPEAKPAKPAKPIENEKQNDKEEKIEQEPSDKKDDTQTGEAQSSTPQDGGETGEDEEKKDAPETDEQKQADSAEKTDEPEEDSEKDDSEDKEK